MNIEARIDFIDEGERFSKEKQNAMIGRTKRENAATVTANFYKVFSYSLKNDYSLIRVGQKAVILDLAALGCDIL